MEERSNYITQTKDKNRAATKMFVVIFAQERLELTVDCLNIWTFIDKEIDMKETIQMEIYRQTTATTIN